MGKALQIRVSAVTWDLGLVEKLWPNLFELACTVPSSLCTNNKMGVIEMVYRLNDGLQFMKWAKEKQEILGKDIKEATKKVKLIEDALADWNASKANTLSDELEDILNNLEHNYC